MVPAGVAPAPASASLFSRRLVIVGGKGGVGRTTVAAALALAAARHGRRVLIAQMESHERLARLFGHTESIGSDIAPLASFTGAHGRMGRIEAVNMNPRTALREYGIMTLKYESVYRAIFENRPVQSFLGAVPGLSAYSMLGKAWFHTTERDDEDPARWRYDVVVLDGPASGHASTMLRIPQAILDAMPMGPLSRDARAMRELLSDPARAAFVVVTLPEELPVREAADLAGTVREVLAIPLGPLLLNGYPDDSLADGDLRAAVAALPVGRAPAPIEATLVGLRALIAARREAERLTERLARDPGLPIVKLPKIFAADLGLAETERLAALLADL
jgi:hypothetical protein